MFCLGLGYTITISSIEMCPFGSRTKIYTLPYVGVRQRAYNEMIYDQVLAQDCYVLLVGRGGGRRQLKVWLFDYSNWRWRTVVVVVVVTLPVFGNNREDGARCRTHICSVATS